MHPASMSPSPVPSPQARRRERKRATDRKSQQNHRERQRAYVRSLEETILNLKRFSNSDDRAAELLAENDRLQKRVDTLAAQLRQIRGIVCECEEETHNPAHVRDESSDYGLQNAQEQNLQCHMQSIFVSPTTAVPASSPSLDPPPDVESWLSTQCFNIAETELPSEASANGIATCLDLLGPFENSLSSSYPVHVPQYKPSLLAGDALLHAMLDEARGIYRSGNFDVSKPSLRKLLSPDSSDVLAFRLFHYIKSYGPIPMHLLLGIFWVQYLFLRWNVLWTAESYAMVPYFLRPALLEASIPHHICINMLVWPDIRKALICDGLSANVEMVSIDLLKSLPSHWSSSLAITGDIIGSMDVFQMIETQAARFEFWNVGPSFKAKYPQYKHCNLGKDL